MGTFKKHVEMLIQRFEIPFPDQHTLLAVRHETSYLMESFLEAYLQKECISGLPDIQKTQREYLEKVILVPTSLLTRILQYF